VRQGLSARVSRRVASADKLDAFIFDPHLVRGTEEASMLHHLAQEGDNSLCAIAIHIRQVDLITEEHQPFVEHNRRQNNTVRSLAVLAVMIKGLEHQLRGSGT
jgi:hypothetical protein